MYYVYCIYFDANNNSYNLNLLYALNNVHFTVYNDDYKL